LVFGTVHRDMPGEEGLRMAVRRSTTPEVRLERMTGQAVADGGFDKAILPIGATEYHGPAFPYFTDTLTAETLSESFARELGGTLVLPALAYGVSHHHLAWPWTLSLRPDTLALVVRDIAESLLQHGVRKLLIVSTHDGNPPAATVAARILSQQHDMSVAIFSGWQGKSRAALAGDREIDEDHAGQSEMSMVLYAAPETSRIDLATHEPNQRMDHPVDLIGGFDGTVPKGYSGNAAGASAEEGAAIVAALTNLVVPFLRELDGNGWKRGSWLSGIE
jgi:creatinine amidohydrolase